jgi:predicted ribosomally synthesized peptide with nif11-like leader
VSGDGLKGFFAKLEGDAALQERVRALGESEGREEALCRLAADEGFAFTLEELRAERARPPVAALDDSSLEEVTGGLGCGVGAAASLGPGENIPLG